MFLNFHRSPDNTWDAEASYATVDDAIAAVTKLGGHNIRTSDQEKEYLANATKNSSSEAAKEERRMLLTGLDNSFKELTGIEKENGMKTNDYITGLMKNMMADNKTVKSDFEKFKTDKLSESEAAKEYKALNDKAKTEFKTTLAERDATINQYKSNEFNFKVDLSVKDAMNRISPTLKKIDLIDDAKEVRVNKFYQNYKIVEHEGALILHDKKDDSPIIDPTNGNPLSIFDVLSKEFESLVDSDRHQNGTGAKNKQNQTVSKDDLKLTLPAEINTRMALSDYINSGKLTFEGNVIQPNSPLASKLFMINQYKEDGITLMPVK